MTSETQVQPEIIALGQFLGEFSRESDRGAALAAASMLDDRLRDILASFLADTKTAAALVAGFNAPLGTFSSRIAACHALGLLQDNELREITLIRKIRNEFGHSWKDVSFSGGRVASLCAQLPWLGPSELEMEASPRTRFSFALAILLNDLLWRSRLVLKEKRRLKSWAHTARKGESL